MRIASSSKKDKEKEKGKNPHQILITCYLNPKTRIQNPQNSKESLKNSKQLSDKNLKNPKKNPKSSKTLNSKNGKESKGNQKKNIFIFCSLKEIKPK